MSPIPERLRTALADRYRLDRELGVGGMATVYLAEDLKHSRKVAIKVLKPELAAVLGAERFVQEITTTASLQHPNILPLFDSGSADGFLYYVMPFVEGEALRTRLDRETQLGIDEALRITTEVADALDYAHRHGVVHRDIKPENILLHDGRPMVADFGIALALSAAAGGRMTETGLSLGTPHYMSPEQAAAEKEISPRSDVYSLAAVLYEMLTGNPPHVGASAQQIVMKILTEDVAPVTAMRRTVPANVAAAVSKALEKLPADRFESARTFADALGDSSFRYSSLASDSIETPRGARARRSPLAGVLPWSVAVAAIGVAAWALLRPVAPPAVLPPLRNVLTGIRVESIVSSQRTIAISRDGSTIVAQGPGRMLYVRTSDDTTPRPIAGTEGASSPSISPDGAWVVFDTREGLAKVLLSGGPVLPVVAPGRQADWFSQDSILYYSVYSPAGIRIVGASGGPSRLLSKDAARFPSMLPDHRGVLYAGTGGVTLLDLKTGRSSTIVHGPGANPWYLPTGDIVYGDPVQQAIFAVPFDLRTHRIDGTPVPVLSSVSVSGAGAVDFAVSDNGTLIYVTGQRPPGMRLAWIDTAGAITPLQLRLTINHEFRISHDGTRIAYTDQDGGTVIYDLATGSRSALPDSVGRFPVWLPGDSVLYLSSSARRSWRREPVGQAGRPEVLTTESRGPIVEASPDGKWIVSERLYGPSAPDIYVSRSDSLPPNPGPYLRADWSEIEPAISPDGHWLAYVSNQSDTDEVYVRSFPVPGPAFRISTGDGDEPLWSPRDSALYYVSSATLVRADLRLGRDVSVRDRKRFFTVPPGGARPPVGNFRGIDISPDGARFLVAVYDSGARGDTSYFSGLHTAFVVANWFGELKALMGAAKR